MINHVVAFKLKEFQNDEKTAVRTELKALLEDLQNYQVHPEHQEVVKRVLETTEARAAVDFEF